MVKDEIKLGKTIKTNGKHDSYICLCSSFQFTALGPHL